MSTRINVTVGDGGLLDRNAQQTAANRQARVLADQRATAEAEGVERRATDRTAAGLDPLTGLPASTPSSASAINRLDQEPAANRRGQGLNLGHLWIFGDTRREVRSTGVISATGNGRSATASNSLRGARYDLLLGCGNGGQWRTFADIGTDTAPLLPADTFSVDRQTTRIINPFFSPPIAENFHVGRRSGGSSVNFDRRSLSIALPCGNGNFIYIYGFVEVWHTFESEATYSTIARYIRTAPLDEPSPVEEWDFVGFLNPITGEFDLSTPPDRLEIIQFVESSTIEPVSFQGYRNKERRFAAYVCNNFAIREISVPSGIQPLLDKMCPEPIEATRIESIYSSSVPEGNFVQDIYTIPAPTAFVSGSTGLTVQLSGSFVFTPQVFKSINDSISFTDPSNIKTIPAKLFRGLADRRDGAWAAFRDSTDQPSFPYFSNLYREGSPFHYALWPNKNEQPNLQIWDPNFASVWENFRRPKRVNRATLRPRPDRIPRNGANDSTNVFGPNFYNIEQLVSVWDWDDPAYCRTMCKALGFSDADLTP
jgi:hypothetical protein